MLLKKKNQLTSPLDINVADELSLVKLYGSIAQQILYKQLTELKDISLKQGEQLKKLENLMIELTNVKEESPT